MHKKITVGVLIIILIGIGIWWVMNVDDATLPAPDTDSGLNTDDPQDARGTSDSVSSAGTPEPAADATTSLLCFKDQSDATFKLLPTEAWERQSYKAGGNTISLLMPKGYSITPEANQGAVQSGSAPFSAMLGSITIRATDVQSDGEFLTGYRNEYAGGISFSSASGWQKQDAKSATYPPSNASCTANAYARAGETNIFLVRNGDAGGVDETFIIVENDTVLALSMAYVIGGDAAEGLNTPSDPKAVAQEIRSVLVTALGTVEIRKN